MLVTGATGFLGAHLTRRLVELGAEVRILRREQSSLAQLGDVDVETALGDICDPDAVRRAVSGCEWVFHVAGAVSYWSADDEWLYAVNVGGTENVIAACLDANVARLIHTSSVAAVGIPPELSHADEMQPYDWGRHECGYMTTKFLGETRVREAGDELDVVIVNPAVIIGPGDWRNFGPLVELVARGLAPGYPSGGSNFVEVADVVEGHLLAATKGKRGERYILGGENLSWREFITLVSRHFGRRPGFRLPLGPMKLAASLAELGGRLTGRRPVLTRQMTQLADLDLYYTSDKARKELGYCSKTIDDSLFHALSWYEEHGFRAPKG